MASPSRHVVSWPAIVVFGLALCVSCGDAGEGEGAGTATRGAATVGGDVVSTVDGHPITVADVGALARAGRVSPQEALRRLQAELLLMAEAERRGLAVRRAVREVGRKASVHALLDEEANAATVPREQLRARYKQHNRRFNRPEVRSSLHALAQLDDNASPEQEQAGKEFAQAMLERFRATDDPTRMIEGLHGQKRDGYTVVIQKLPPVPDTAGFAKPYLDGLFSVDEAGVVPEVVRTSFGWHAIVVTEIKPALSMPFEEAEAELREEGLGQARVEAVDGLLRRLRTQTPVEVDQGAQEALASLEL